MKKILITGAAGFLGSNLCKKLINDNYLICLDNFYTGSKENIKPFLNNSNFKFIKHDIITPIDIECDEIYNLACPASPIHYQKDPIYTLNCSIKGVENMLHLANKYNAKILQASTSEVYGNPLIHPQEEEYFGNVNPVGIRSCYDEGKRVAETMLFDNHRTKKTKIKIARIFNTYGLNMQKDDGRVISNFITQALLNKDITVYGDGSQTRSFCYCEDLIDGLIKLMNAPDSLNTPVNLGCDGEYTILDLAKIIIKKTNSKSKIIFKNLPSDDPVKRKPNLKKAKTFLNWQPITPLDIGLDYTINWFRRIIL